MLAKRSTDAMADVDLQEKFKSIGLAEPTAKYGLQCRHCRSLHSAYNALRSVPRPCSFPGLLRHARADFSLARCRTAVKNKKLKSELETIITEAGVTTGCPKQQGTLLYDCASKVNKPNPQCIIHLAIETAGVNYLCICSTQTTHGSIGRDLYWTSS